ncbi:Fc.00g011740.m01.CDS01 [Cosmosporella sp. VM-42]
MSHSLATKKSLAPWHANITNHLEKWSREVHLDTGRVDAGGLDNASKVDPKIRQMLGEVLDVLCRHLEALTRCPSVISSVGDRRERQSLSQYSTTQHTSKVTKRSPNSSRRSSSEEGKRRSPAKKSERRVSRQYLSPEAKSMSAKRRAESVKSAPPQAKAKTTRLERPLVDESKRMVDYFIQNLFNLTNSLPPAVFETDESPHMEAGFSQDLDAEVLYRAVYKTSSTLLPQAKPFIRRRITAAVYRRVKEAVATHAPEDSNLRELLSNQWLRRISSWPLDSKLAGDEGQYSLHDQTLRRVRTGPMSPGPYSEELRGVGGVLEPKQDDSSPEDATFRDSTTLPDSYGLPDSSAPTRLSYDGLYVCFVESCSVSDTLYDNLESWEAHIRSNHPRALNRATWTCRAWCHSSEPNGYPSFDSATDFEEHMLAIHPDSFDSDLGLLRYITDASYEAPESCQLCGEDGKCGGKDENAFLRHAAAHLQETSSKIVSLLPASKDLPNGISSTYPSQH